MLAEFAIKYLIPYMSTASLVVSPTIAVSSLLIGHEPNCEVTAFFNAMHNRLYLNASSFVIPVPSCDHCYGLRDDLIIFILSLSHLLIWSIDRN